MSEQIDTTPTTRMAWGAGFTTTAEDGTVLDAWFGWLGWGEEGEVGLAGVRERHDAMRNVTVAPVRITVDVDALAELAQRVQPRLITIGGSLNLSPHPVGSVREVADSVGAHLLFDAAHLCGMFAGRRWESPLSQGAHLMTMSTYKSLGGPFTVRFSDTSYFLIILLCFPTGMRDAIL